MPSGFIDPKEHNVEKIDLGCGSKKREGYFGFDFCQLPGVDHVCDLTKGIPLPDNCVGEIYSSHFLEHIDPLQPILHEIVRVCRDRARLELWVPCARNDMALCPGHKYALSETVFEHISCNFSDAWFTAGTLPFVLERFEYHYVKSPATLRNELGPMNITLEFARKHLFNIVHEVGFIGSIAKHRVR